MSDSRYRDAERRLRDSAGVTPREPRIQLPGWWLTIVLFAIALSACGGNESSDASEPPSTPTSTQTYTSADGLLEVIVPPEAMDTEAELSIEVLDQADWPQQLSDELSDALPVGPVYALEPSGLVFAEPVTLVRRLDMTEFGLEESEVAVILIALRSDDGTWELLEDHVATVEGGQVVVSATTTHFSTAVAFGGSVRVSVDPASVVAAPGDEWDATFTVEVSRDVDVGLFFHSPQARVTGAVTVVEGLRAGGSIFEGRFGCGEEPGEGLYGAKVEFQEDAPLAGFMGFAEAVDYAIVVGQARCVAPDDDQDSVADDLQPLTPDAILGGPITATDEEDDCDLWDESGDEAVFEPHDCEGAMDIRSVEVSPTDNGGIDFTIGMSGSELEEAWNRLEHWLIHLSLGILLETTGYSLDFYCQSNGVITIDWQATRGTDEEIASGEEEIIEESLDPTDSDCKVSGDTATLTIGPSVMQWFLEADEITEAGLGIRAFAKDVEQLPYEPDFDGVSVEDRLDGGLGIEFSVDPDGGTEGGD